MATLNEVKYIYMAGAADAGGANINELEHAWLELEGASPELSLNEKWYEVFGQTDMAWNEAAHAWLTLQGIPEEGTLNERFYVYWATGGGGGPVIVPPPLISMGDVWKQIALNDWIWTPGGQQFPALNFGPIKNGKPYSVSGEITVFTGAGTVDVRLGEDTLNMFSLSGVGSFSGLAQAGVDNQLLRVIVNDNVSMSAVQIKNIRLQEVFGSSGTGVLRLSGSNYRIGTANGLPDAPTPDNIAGLEIFYLGSFGQAFWNLRLGALGTDQIPGVTQIRVQLGSSLAATLTWDVPTERYAGSAGQDLWAILGPDVDTDVPFDILVL